MKIESQSIPKGYCNYYNPCNYNNTTYAKNINSPAFKSVLYNPKSIIHRVNPVLMFLDGVFKRSVAVSRKMWRSPDKALKPHLKVIDIEDKKQPHVRMWDINNADKTRYAVVLHGLSHNITSLQEMYKKIISDTNYAVLAPEYHGFTPENKEDIYIDPKNILRDIKNSIKYLNEKGIKNKNISIIGHSFGGYAASRLANEYPDLESVILVSSINTNEHQGRKLQENRYRHVPKTIKKIIKSNPLSILPLKLIFNTGKALKKVEAPVDIIHSKGDKYINIKTCIELAHSCKNLRSVNIIDGYHPMDENKIETIVSILKSQSQTAK